MIQINNRRIGRRTGRQRLAGREIDRLIAKVRVDCHALACILR